jgi:MFS family permease
MSPSAIMAKPQRGILLDIAPFVLVVFLACLTVGMPLAAIPLQVHDVLGFDNLTVGIVIGTQSLATVATRQFAGTLCDRRGAKFTMLLGGGGSVLAGAVYLLATLPAPSPSVSLALLLVARLISGLAESLVITGSLAGAIGLVSAQNTGKVMVWIGIGLYAAIAVGSPIGIWLMNHQAATGGFAAVAAGVITCSVLATAVVVFTTTAARHHGERLPFTSVIGRVAPFGAGLALATIAFGAIGAFAALDFQSKGWSGAGFALTGFGVAYVFTRMIFGGWPDRFGGARVAT